jgi:hypothetical protein
MLILVLKVSVQKVVPTLTSTSAEIYLSMVGVKQLSDTSFILVPTGAVHPVGVCSRHCIALHHGACRGELQEAVPPGPWGLIEAGCQYRGEGGKRVSVRYPPPRGWGTTSSFYRPRRGSLQTYRTVLSYVWWYGVQCHCWRWISVNLLVIHWFRLWFATNPPLGILMM